MSRAVSEKQLPQAKLPMDTNFDAMMIAVHMTFVSSSSGSEAAGLVLSMGIASMYRAGLAFEIDR